MKKKLSALTLAVLFAALSLVSCGSGVANEADFYDTMVVGKSESYNSYSGGWGTDTHYVTSDAADAEANIKVKDFAQPEAEEVSIQAQNSSVQKENTRKIVYSSDYEIQTKDYDASASALDALCEKYGAYFENAYTYGSADLGERRSNYTIRVPVENYAAFIGEAGTLGVVISSSQNNRDVTEAYYDTEARLQSAMIREERVLEILKNASKLDDVLALERELADIRYEIESYTGTLRKYDSLVNFSTVTINLYEVSEVVVPKVTPLTFGERVNKGFASGINDFVESIQDFVVDLSYNFIGVIIWIVFIAIIAVVIVRLVKKARRNAKKTSGKPEPTSAQDKTDSGKDEK